jgi:hypothetical protein
MFLRNVGNEHYFYPENGNDTFHQTVVTLGTSILKMEVMCYFETLISVVFLP